MGHLIVRTQSHRMNLEGKNNGDKLDLSVWFALKFFFFSNIQGKCRLLSFWKLIRKLIGKIVVILQLLHT